MTDLLLQEILKAKDSLQDIKFPINDTEFHFYYNYLTLLEKSRIEQMCVKAITTVHDNGTKTISHEKQEHLYPVHLILEKALDKNGKRLFTHTNPQHFDIISKLPAQLATYIATVMNTDVMNNLEKDNDDE
jgi:hypothetical protein